MILVSSACVSCSYPVIHLHLNTSLYFAKENILCLNSHGSFLQNNPAVHSFKEGFFIFHPYFPFWLHPSFSPIYEIRLHDIFIQCGASTFHVNIVRIQLKKKKKILAFILSISLNNNISFWSFKEYLDLT